MSVLHFHSEVLRAGTAVPCFFQQPPRNNERPAAPRKTATPRAASDDGKSVGEKLARQAILKAEQAAGFWDEVFLSAPPTRDDFAEAIVFLHDRKHYKVAVEGMLSAIRNDQSAPWIYDVLALEMKLAGRSPNEIARVLESRIDFATSDIPQMLITVALLSRFNAWDEAISVCREAAKLNPDFPEVWMLGRSVADKSGQIDAQVWARCGILQYVWGDNYERHHEEARKVLRELASKCDRENKSELAEQIRSRAADAGAVDLQIVLSWVGSADLDLVITEPDGEKSSFKKRVTRNRGRLVHEEGPKEESQAGNRRFEQYVCHSALSGDYQIDVRFVFGKAVTGTAVLEIIQHAGTADEQRTSKTVALSKDDVKITTTLKNGRAIK